MIHPIERAKKVVGWLATPPDYPNPRGVTILMWALIAGTSGFVVRADNQQDQQARKEAVCVVRLALNDLYDFAEELGSPADVINEARARLDRLIPDLDCPARELLTAGG